MASPEELSPDSEPLEPKLAEVHSDEANVELPPMTPAAGNAEDAIDQWSADQPAKRSLGGFGSVIASAILVGAIVVGGIFALRGGSFESDHANWQHIEAAEAISPDGVTHLVGLDGTGSQISSQQLDLTAADKNAAITAEVQRAIAAGDLASAEAALQAAQSFPKSAKDGGAPTLDGNQDLVNDLKDGKKELFEIELFDCCSEDGDVVDVLVNGNSFATVPIMHAGTKLCIPLAQGGNTITIQGAKDGTGGVTLSFRTSRGDFFARNMRVGQSYDLNVMVH